MCNLVKSSRWVIAVRCLSCRHRGVIAEADPVRFGLGLAPRWRNSNRLRCRKCGSAASLHSEQPLEALPDATYVA